MRRGGRVREAVSDYVKALSRRVPVKEAYLTGSRARGDWLETSDIDIIVVSPAFEGLTPYERGKILHSAWTSDYDVDLIGLTEEEFAKGEKESVVFRETLKGCVRVHGSHTNKCSN